MLTDDAIARFSDLAGSDFAWDCGFSTARPPGTYRTELRRWLIEAQGGICPRCGESGNARGAWEFNHVVSRGPGIKGFVDGNVFAGHSSCNAATKPVHDADGNVVAGMAVIPLTMFARPDVVPMEWPTPVELRARACDRKAGRL